MVWVEAQMYVYMTSLITYSVYNMYMLKYVNGAVDIQLIALMTLSMLYI